MTSIISVLSGGSVVQSQALRVADSGKVKRIRVVPGGQYVLADVEGGPAAGMLIKRSGKNLVLAHETDGPEREALVIEDFYGSHARLFGVGADGRYQPYAVAAILDGVETNVVADGNPVFLQLGTPSAAADTMVADDVTSAEVSRVMKAPAPLQDAAKLLGGNDGGQVAVSGHVDASEWQSPAVEAQEGIATVALYSADVLPGAVVEPIVHAVADVPVDTGYLHTETAIAQIEHVVKNAGSDAVVSDGSVAVVAAGGAVPAVDALIDDHGIIQGVVENGGVTDDGRPEIIGKAESGVLVHLYDGKYLIGHTTANDSGTWSFVPGVPMADGRHVITVVYQYPNGDISDKSAPYVVTIDKVVPRIPIINDILDDEGRIQGQIGNGSVTDDNRPTIHGLAEPLSTLIIYDKGKEIDRVSVDAEGKWSFTPTTPLFDGLHILDFAAVDRAGNMSERSSTTEFLVDTRAELVSIFAAEDRAGEVKGNFVSGGVTDDTHPRLFGSATAGGIVSIYEGSQLLGKVTAGVDGAWEFIPTGPLSEGVHSLTATVTTDAKGESDRSASFDFTVDVTAPDSPTIAQVYDDRGTLQGALSNGQSTDDTTPTLSGAAEAGSIVRIYDNGNLLGSTVANPAGKWSYVPNPSLADGDHVFSATAEDKAGNVSLPSDKFAIAVDTVPPAPPVIESVYDDQGDRTGLLNSGDITDDAKPTINGSAEANATVVIRDHGLEIGRTVANDKGEWTFEPFLPMGLGAHKLTAEAIDAAGNVGGLSNQFNLILASPELPAVPAITSVVDDVGSITGNLLKNDVTDDPRPTINGTAQPGMTVSVFIDGVLSGTTEVAANGDWSFTPTADLSDGLHNITARATNIQGNTGLPTSEYPIVVDTTPPLVPTPADAALWDDVGLITGKITSGMVTDDNTPTFIGKAEANATIVIYDDGKEIGRASTNASGTWSFTPSPVLVDGEHKLSYLVIDKAGNVGPKSEAIVFNVTTEVVFISIDGATDDVGSVTGEIGKNGITDDSTPTIHGKGIVGGTVKVYEDGVLLGQTVVGADGKWSITPATPLNEGAHSLSATISTEANGQITANGTFDFTIDLTPPAKPSIDSITDDVGSIQGKLVHGQDTDDTTPTLAGKAEAGSTVRIFDNGSLLGSVVADVNGVWGFTPITSLNNGKHDFTVTAVDKAGNASVSSEVFGINIDTVPPAKPVILLAYDDQGGEQGELASGAVTDDSKPVFSGTAEPNSTVVIKDKGEKIGTALVGSDGKWSFEPSTPLSLDKHEITVEAVDKAGNTSVPSDRFDLEVVSDVAPAEPAITSVIDDVGSITGSIQKNAVTDDARPTINGTAQAGMTVSVYIDGVLSGSTVVAANGEWSYTPGSDLADGLHNITAKAINGVGNSSTETGQYPINVDTTRPEKPGAGDATLLDDEGQVTGAITDGMKTDDATPTFEGKGEPNGKVIIYDNGKKIGEAASDASGNWSFTPSPGLEDGAHSFNYEVVDQAGNVSPKSDAINFEVDTSEVVVSIDGATDNAGSVTGEIGKNGITDDTTPTLHGKGTIGGTVKVYEGGVLLGQAVVGVDGKWSVTPATPLGEGAHSLNATITTAVDGEIAGVGTFDFTIDISAPNKPSIDSITDDVGSIQGKLVHGQDTDDTTPTLAGKAEAGSTVKIFDNGSLLGTVVADPAGEWSFTPNPPLLNGKHDFTVTAVDKAGNASVSSDVFDINIDTVPPTAPAIETVLDDVGAKTGNLAQGDMTDDTMPTISGTAEAGSTVVIKDKGTKIGSVVAGSDGKWTFEPSVALAAGEHEFTAEAVDAAGNVSQPSSGFAITVDTVLPTTPKISNLADDVGIHQGLVMNGSVTDDTKPELGGTGKAGETIEIRIDGVALGRTVVNENGRWSFTPETALKDGHYIFTAVAISAGGAESVSSNVFAVEIDTKGPDRPLVENVEDDAGAWQGSLANGQVTDDRTPTFSGKAEAGSVIMVFDNGEEVGDAPVDDDGNWIYQSKVLSFGEHNFTFYAIDPAGNWSLESAPWTVIVAISGRSLDKVAETDGLLSVQELLLDGQAELFAHDTAVLDAELHAVPIVNLQVNIATGGHESWVVTDDRLEARGEWMSSTTAEAFQSPEQHWSV